MTTLPQDHVREVGSDLPDGMIDYAARTAIRDLIRLHGFPKAREMVAYYLTDEADQKEVRSWLSA